MKIGVVAMASRDEKHNERLLAAAGYRYDAATDSWRDPDRNRALAGAMVPRLTEGSLRRWIVAGKGRSAYGVSPGFGRGSSRR